MKKYILLAFLLFGAQQASAGVSPIESSGASSTVATSTYSCTTAVTESFARTALGQAVSGSSVTFTPNGTGPVQLSFNGSCQNSVGASDITLAFLQDGALVPSASQALRIRDSAATGTACSISWIVSPPSAAQHTWAITAASGSGTLTIPYVHTGQVCVHQL